MMELLVARTMLIAAVVAMALALTAPAAAARPSGAIVRGTVESGDTGLGEYSVSVYAAFVDHKPRWVRLGSDTTDGAGIFQITYSVPRGRTGSEPLLFVEATRGDAMLASAVGFGLGAVPAHVVVNERTTVATGNAFAQFVDRRKVEGNRYGMTNAVHMAANLADPQTGAVGSVLASTPNGLETSTLATFNSLANAVASCIAEADDCTRLFEATRPPGGRPPSTVLQAVANIVRYPSYPADRAVLGDPVFQLSRLTRSTGRR
jgi:hypothetical protein